MFQKREVFIIICNKKYEFEGIKNKIRWLKNSGKVINCRLKKYLFIC